ncbi:hypothetical protein BAZSYMA_ACONTIG57715_2 [Bathymodiolus azoricus thioautotrophic gill symbiont]|uniref:Uncharacterized protein n=1 Tax=Bathymodiolus azoricus thioautotrophic gill symbiont TaxID=235205 RepID=A0A1H6MB56_9GAMM|nr:hypothetical protein BAZSYMA_ACONTIG57715_2 [Bathymodiolus azoricus thioautotrophic gill symbiont]
MRGNFLIKNPNNAVKNCNRINKHDHHSIRQCNQAKYPNQSWRDNPHQCRF